MTNMRPERTSRLQAAPVRLPALASALLFLGLLAPLGVQGLQDVPPPRPMEQDPYQVGEAMPPADEGAVVVTLTLQEAIDRALENNLDMQSARLGPEIQRQAWLGAQAQFNPSLQANLGYNNATTQSTTQLDGGERITTERNTFNLGFNQPLPWYGTQLTANFNNARTSTDNIFATRNPSYTSTMSFGLSQPLLAGRRIDSQRNALRTQEVQQGIADLQLRNQIDLLSAEVRNSYWLLRASIEQIEIQLRSLAQAEQLLENNRIRVQLGTMVEMELAQAEAQVASAEQALLNAEIQWRNQELNFKRLLVGGTDDPLYHETINPVDIPEVEEFAVDIQAAIERAVQNRPDFQAATRQREVSRMNLDVSRDNTRPSLNLNLSYQLQGVGGDLFDRPELGGDPQLLERSGYWDGIQSIASLDSPTFNVGLNFSYPIGRSVADANLAQARLQLRQSELQLQSQQLLIETEVTNAGLAVRNAFLQVEAARRSREAAERSADAEMTRFNVGVSTNFQVVAAQDALTQARLSELQATINLVNAIAEFERVQGVGDW
jgi:outer membrane protein